jgi:pimeloyl-ACP methyl ester carboxylesterase
LDKKVFSDCFVPLVDRRSARHKIRSVNYHVSEWGDPAADRLLVMLHGWGDAGSTFQFLVDELKDDWFVIAPDWRGFGASSSRAESYWFPDYVADLDALLRIYSPDKPANLLGHSMGGNIAALYAGIFPDRVARLIDIEGFGLAERDPADAPVNYRRWIEMGRTGVTHRSYDSYAELAHRIQRQDPRLPSDKAHFVAAQWAAQGEDGTVTIKADPAHKLPNPILYRRGEAEACWRQVSAPALVVVGAESRFRSEAESWLAPDAVLLPFASVQTVTIRDAGHMVHFEQPGALAAVVEEFLRV